ncbi:GspE/PulE family protein [Aliidiomarina quisquiliarum]|uniref:GspE/PulE family protein n=1 Tax=Aliidiomarina quisquiliarum TaxID=2938947 RepID=UPI00208E6361|nr:Flp pilus assembly complex ATPase component TadA [Aliidiomarina quisquiliarum]
MLHNASAQLPIHLAQLLFEMANTGVSDMHLEAQDQHYLVRERLLGKLQQREVIAKHVGEQWVAALKNAAGADVTQRRVAQDGRFKLLHGQLVLDCRFNVLPTLWGEKIVLRLFNQQDQALPLSQLGLLPNQYQQVSQALAASQGLVLVTGPTGSGKTRSLYAMLEHINHPSINISTVEDPIEIPLLGINQTAVRDNGLMRFADCLRALLRQDPDVIMVGEIRDAETAQMTVQAAQTGHLVLATLHASNAMAALIRLQQLGVTHAQVAGALSLLINQRLVTIGQKRAGVFDVNLVDEQAQHVLLSSPTSPDYWQRTAELLKPVYIAP